MVGEILRLRALSNGSLRPWPRIVGVLALSSCLAGCLTGSENPDPAPDVPLFYRAAGKGAERALPTLQWWRDFRSTELTRLVETAQSANLDIAAAVARIVQADAQARVAGAPLLPTLDFSGEAQRSRQSANVGASSGTGAGAGRSGRNLYTASLNASYEIDFWGKNLSAYRSAEQTAAASRYDRDVVELSTVASVIDSYFQVLAAQDRLRIARENLRSANRVLDVIKQRLAVGTASALDVAQQETLVANLRAAIPPLEQTRLQTINTLAVLLGSAPERITIRGGSMRDIAIPKVTPGLPSTLLQQRPDIRQAEAQIAAANGNVESARAAMFPSIKLTGSTGLQSLLLSNLLSPGSSFYSIAADIAQPIFDGFRLQGQLDLAKGQREELIQNYRKAVISAFTDVENALIARQQLTVRERLQAEAVASSRRAFDISESQLRAGTIDLITLLNTQQSLFQAQDALAQTRLARLQAVLSLYQALGGGWDRELIMVLAKATPPGHGSPEQPTLQEAQ